MSAFPDFTEVAFDAERPLVSGQTPSAAPWSTPEGIDVSPTYGPADIEGLSGLDGYPGLAPFLRGPYPTMYATNPWTIRQYAGFSSTCGPCSTASRSTR